MLEIYNMGNWYINWKTKIINYQHLTPRPDDDLVLAYTRSCLPGSIVTDRRSQHYISSEFFKISPITMFGGNKEANTWYTAASCEYLRSHFGNRLIYAGSFCSTVQLYHGRFSRSIHPTARPWATGCLLWVKCLTSVLPWCAMLYATSCHIWQRYNGTKPHTITCPLSLS